MLYATSPLLTVEEARRDDDGGLSTVERRGKREAALGLDIVRHRVLARKGRSFSKEETRGAFGVAQLHAEKTEFRDLCARREYLRVASIDARIVTVRGVL
jgi:hypothetical protein